MADTSPIELTKHLKGVDYPASKQAVIDTAKGNGAPKDVLDGLERIPDREYEGPSGVTHEFFA
ncbi:DUF2795 domain-containing protein [Quadrisphaera sp. KR29]|uniref:DUF2795 domain-containing protein n=1 Tax=Quadrisphaera sp. KR29 TaxID=3461391 RepID=UPI0040440F54